MTPETRALLQAEYDGKTAARMKRDFMRSGKEPPATLRLDEKILAGDAASAELDRIGFPGDQRYC